MTTINFTTKAEYLAWRSGWKAEYAQLSQDIRDLKWLRRTHAQAYSKAETILGERRPVTDHYYNEFNHEMREHLAENTRYVELERRIIRQTDSSCFTGLLRAYSAKATALLEQLKAAKLEAQRQYQNHKNATANASCPA